VKVRACLELACGTGALGLRLNGLPLLCPYMGNKKNWAQPILDTLGIEPGCQLLLFNDLGPWGKTWGVIANSGQHAQLVERLKEISRLPARGNWECFKRLTVPLDPVEYAARFLCLQRWAYAGKPVSEAGRKWKVPGYCKAAADGIAATDKFGAVKPQLPTLIRRLESYTSLPWVIASDQDARTFPNKADFIGPEDLVYLDPNYRGSTGYANGLSRAGVVKLGHHWAAQGATVVISEAEPIEELLGWEKVSLEGKFTGQTPKNFAKKRVEWITFKRAAR